MERRVGELMVPMERMLTLNENETIEGTPAAALYLLERDHSLGVVGRLARNGISSAPLVCRSKGLAFVDVLDLLAYLIKVCTSPIERESAQGGQSHALTVDDMATLIKRSKEYLLSHVRDVLGCSERNPYMAVKQNTTIGEAVKLMVEKKLHRLAVEDDEERLVGMLSQSHIVQMLIPDIQRIPDLGDKKVRDIEMTTIIKGVSPHTAAIDAFIIMQQENLSSLAVIDDQGHLVDNLSARDLKGIAFEANLKCLTKPLPEFFRERELLNLQKRQLVTVPPDMSFVDMLRKMLSEQVHRVYVVEETGNGTRKPVGVISLTDVLRQLAKS